MNGLLSLLLMAEVRLLLVIRISPSKLCTCAREVRQGLQAVNNSLFHRAPKVSSVNTNLPSLNCSQMTAQRIYARSIQMTALASRRDKLGAIRGETFLIHQLLPPPGEAVSFILPICVAATLSEIIL